MSSENPIRVELLMEEMLDEEDPLEWTEIIVEKLGLRRLCDYPALRSVRHSYATTYQSAARSGFKFFAQFAVDDRVGAYSSLTVRVVND